MPRPPPPPNRTGVRKSTISRKSAKIWNKLNADLFGAQDAKDHGLVKLNMCSSAPCEVQYEPDFLSEDQTPVLFEEPPAGFYYTTENSLRQWEGGKAYLPCDGFR